MRRFVKIAVPTPLSGSPDQHVLYLSEKLTEVILMQEPSDELKATSGNILATRGVRHGGVEVA